METDDIRIILMDLPTKVKGFVYYDCDYVPCIVINSRMPLEIQRETVKHEKQHIKNGDMDNMNYREYSA